MHGSSLQHHTASVQLESERAIITHLQNRLCAARRRRAKPGCWQRAPTRGQPAHCEHGARGVGLLDTRTDDECEGEARERNVGVAISIAELRCHYNFVPIVQPIA